MSQDTEIAPAPDLVWPPRPLGELIGFGWGDCADQDAWDALAEWVDWFFATYDLAGREGLLKPCWPDHPGVVEELAALWMAWADSAAKSRTGDGDALAYWHDRYLAGFLARLPIYRMKGCSDESHQAATRKPYVSNRTLISVRDNAISLSDVRAGGE